MKHPFRFSILPYVTMGAGGLGLALRIWLFSATDQKGLLPASHAADTLLYIISALTLGILFLATRNPQNTPSEKALLRKIRMPVGVLAGVCLLFSAWMFLTGIHVSLAIAACAACLVAGAILIVTTFMKAPAFSFRVVFTAALMIQTVAQCQIWGAEPQLQVYFFPLMACVFSILAAYQSTALAVGQGKRTLFAFFNQSALFFCCISLNSRLWPLYLGLGLWMVTQLIYCYPRKKEA